MRYYDEISTGYYELYGKEQNKKLAIILNHFKPKKTDRLLDVGCGSGLSTRVWKCKTVGVDPSFKLLPKGQYYINAEAEHLPFKDSSFDIVISVTALHNFHDIRKGLQEIKRVGKKRFIFSILKKTAKAEKIEKLIKEFFSVKKIIIEDKDIIYFI